MGTRCHRAPQKSQAKFTRGHIMSHDYLNLMVIAGAGLLGLAIANVIIFLMEMRTAELKKSLANNYGPFVFRGQVTISVMLIAYGLLGIYQK
jgi:hypothetical protein